MTKTELFIELAKPDQQGCSSWVETTQFEGKYSPLKLGNGGSWCRASSALAKKFIIEFDKSQTSGNSIDRIRVIGKNSQATFNQNISLEIKRFYKDKKCVMLGVNGRSENTKIEIDHKDGRKADSRVSDSSTQHIDDFQPLCKAANDIKRQICKNCKETDKRWSAKNIKGNPYDFYEGDENFSSALGCKGCYQFDPVEYRKTCTRKICLLAAENAATNVFNQLYPNETE